jgi:hypothetical protein
MDRDFQVDRMAIHVNKKVRTQQIYSLSYTALLQDKLEYTWTQSGLNKLFRFLWQKVGETLQLISWYLFNFILIYSQMSRCKCNCNWYPEDTLCITIKGQLEIKGIFWNLEICTYCMHNQMSHRNTLTYYSLFQLTCNPNLAEHSRHEFQKPGHLSHYSDQTTGWKSMGSNPGRAAFFHLLLQVQTASVTLQNSG